MIMSTNIQIFPKKERNFIKIKKMGCPGLEPGTRRMK